MCHALIIDQNIAVSRAIQSYLRPLGFASFDLAWTGEQALRAAHRRRPDMIVIGDDTEAERAFDAARRISSNASIPVLMITGNPEAAAEKLAQATSYDGPFHLNEIERAVETALHPVPQLQ